MAEVADETNPTIKVYFGVVKVHTCFGYWSINLQFFTESKSPDFFFCISLQIFGVLRLRGLKMAFDRTTTTTERTSFHTKEGFCSKMYM